MIGVPPQASYARAWISAIIIVTACHRALQIAPWRIPAAPKSSPNKELKI
jgi:hypothetical protein